ncbi:hypothetical protein ACHWQZ_G017858 [Mnemiopsis leidyi]
MHVAYIKFIVCDKELQGWTLGREIHTGWNLGREPVIGRRARFPPETWNQTDRVEIGMGRTNNFCESFNKTFSDVVGHSKPSIYNFLSAVQLEQSSTEGKITSCRQGRQPPARKKRWVGKDAAMKRIVGNYHLYENRVTEFLDELSQL